MAKQFSPKQIEAQKKFAAMMAAKKGTGKNPKHSPAAPAAPAAAKSDEMKDENILIGAVVIIAVAAAAWYFFFREKDQQQTQQGNYQGNTISTM